MIKKYLFWIVLFMTSWTAWAQNDVSLVVSGEGKDKNEATFNALRSAIEQVCGTFISTNTTILDDRLVSDEVVSLSSGNIKNFEYVTESMLPNGNTLVTLQAVVSVDHLTSFCESKGMTAELKGAAFAMNIKKMEFDKIAEEKAVENLCDQLESMLPTLFDYKIEVDEPRIVSKEDARNLRIERKDEIYEVPFRINVIGNDNLYTFCYMMAKTLAAIGLDSVEYNKYRQMNREVHDFRKSQIVLKMALTNMLKEIYKTIPNTYNEIPSHHIEYERYIKYDDLFVSVEDIFNAFFGNKYFYDEESWVRVIRGPFLLRSANSIDRIEKMYNKFERNLFNFVISDGLKDIEIYVDKDSITTDRYEKYCSCWPIWFVTDILNTSCYNLESSKEQHCCFSSVNAIRCYVNAKMLSYNIFDEVVLYVKDNNIFGKNFKFWSDFDRKEYVEYPPIYETTIEAVLYYSLDEISKINNIKVKNADDFTSIQEPQTNQPQAKNIQETNSKYTLYNDTLQHAVNNYNFLLKRYPYDYQEKSLSYTLPQELSEQENLLHDTLQILLIEIREKTEQLIAQYKKDSLEYQQENNLYQKKVDEVNQDLLAYPYNLDKRIISDSLPMNLFGKSEDLIEEMKRRIRALPEKQQQIEQEVYVETRTNQPQRFVSIFFSLPFNNKSEADSLYIECRCNFADRLAFDLAYIDKSVTSCNCRQAKYDEVGSLFHSREEFDQSYNQQEAEFNLEIADRKTKMIAKNNIRITLQNSKQLNFKKALSTSNEELKSLVNKINYLKGKYYYDDAIELVYIYNDRLMKEWEKNGTYFKSKTEMYEYYIGEDYDKVLKQRKKE